MRRWLYILGALVIVVSSGAVIRSQTQAAARTKFYTTKLQAYSNDLKPGLTRAEAEGYLQRKATGFRQMCCVLEPSAFADLVWIGQEKAPWFCSEEYVYVALVFERSPQATSTSRPVSRFPIIDVDSTDVLKAVRLYKQPSGCL